MRKDFLGRGEPPPRSCCLWCKWGPLPLMCSAREGTEAVAMEWDEGRQESEDEVGVDKGSG